MYEANIEENDSWIGVVVIWEAFRRAMDAGQRDAALQAFEWMHGAKLCSPDSEYREEMHLLCEIMSYSYSRKFSRP